MLLGDICKKTFQRPKQTILQRKIQKFNYDRSRFSWKSIFTKNFGFPNFKKWGYFGGWWGSLLDDLTSGSPILKDCEINLYPKTYLRGSKTTITNKMNSTVTDLSLHSFDDKLKSLEVKGPCCWVIFADKHFRGPQKQFRTGQYKSSTMIGADLVGLASSLIILVSWILKISDYNWK